ncbi:MAG: metallophosphoesterase [Armatimonadota bacterium]|nr:metallophosphoesterase [Armatimonadota bacterium]
MKRLAWVTDIHLEWLDQEQFAVFCRSIVEAAPDALLISGDIATASSVENYLLQIEKQLQRPIYFVLGNHDFYDGSINAVRAAVQALSHRSRWLRWPPDAGVIELTEKTGLVGHDGWADGRLGDYAHSRVQLNDYVLIADLVDPQARLTKLHALGDEAAAHFRNVLPDAFNRFHSIVLITHVPPFKEACWHQGQLSDDNWLPHFACKAVGEALVEVMQTRPDRELLVLCGHTHSPGVAQILPNLKVITGGARYGAPRIQQVLEII